MPEGQQPTLFGLPNQQPQPNGQPMPGSAPLANGGGGVGNDGFSYDKVMQGVITGIFNTPATQFGRQVPQVPPIQPKQQVPQMQTSEQVFPPGGGSANKRIAMNNMFKNAASVIQTIDKNVEQKKIRDMSVHFDRLFGAMQGVEQAKQVLQDPNATPQMKQQAQQVMQQNQQIMGTMLDQSTSEGKKLHKDLKEAFDINLVGEDKNKDGAPRQALQSVMQKRQQQQQQQGQQNAAATGLLPGASQQAGAQQIQQMQKQQQMQQRVQQFQKQFPIMLQQNPQFAAGLAMAKGLKDAGVTGIIEKQIESGSREKVAEMNDNTKMMITNSLIQLHDRDQANKFFDNLNKYYNEQIVAQIKGEVDVRRAQIEARARMNGANADRVVRDWQATDSMFNTQQKQLEVQIQAEKNKLEKMNDPDKFGWPSWDDTVNYKKYKDALKAQRSVISAMEDALIDIGAQRYVNNRKAISHIEGGGGSSSGSSEGKSEPKSEPESEPESKAPESMSSQDIYNWAYHESTPTAP